MAHLERLRKWPRLLRDVKCGWTCPPGWLDPVEKLCELLERIGGVECVQVKEKFGGLRFYTDDESPPVDIVDRKGKRVSIRSGSRVSLAAELIAACESACWDICQDCGEPGVLRQSPRHRGGRLSTLCDHCNARNAQERA